MKGDYANGRIYKIEPICEHDENEVYYGSTCQLLCKRMDKHRSDYKCWLNKKRDKTSSFELFEKYGVENCKIYLVELYPCETKEELFAREGYHIKNNKCVNRYVAGNQLAVGIKEYHQIYRNQHKDENIEYGKIYRENNKQKLKENRTIYVAKNIDKIKEYSQTKNVCSCGGKYTNHDRPKHYRTKKHIKWQNEQELGVAVDV